MLQTAPPDLLLDIVTVDPLSALSFIVGALLTGGTLTIGAILLGGVLLELVSPT